ncbi:MAG: hypothetical protein HQ523_02860 [Lentisphaerae bacterium]|nr:hypothetical protein [Lentisphaerota bacterium]
MKMRFAVCSVVLLLFCGLGASARADVKHRVGVGAHYWVAVEDIEVDNIEQSGFAYLLSYQIQPLWLLKFELALEQLPKYYGGSPDRVYAPQAYVIAGGWIYAALGVGVLYSDGDVADHPFYAVRAGVDFPVLPHVTLDINANYRFMEWDRIHNLGDELSADSVTVGAAVRVRL